MKRFVTVLAAALLVAACSSDPPPTDPPPTFSPGDPATEFGPLAVAVGWNGDGALSEGTLQIQAECVYMVNGRDRTLLVWPAGLVAWNADVGSITYANSDGTTHDLRNGQRVAVGGSGGGFGEGPLLMQMDVTWVAQPSPNCDTRNHWWLGDIRPL